MRKLTILTSVLALAACGGGSGGGAGTPGAIVTPNDNLTPQQRAANSNANVTGMNSFVVIGGSNPTINPNARAASTHVFNQSDGGTRYDLENVTFKTIPTSGVIDDLIFHTDSDGKITSIEFPNAEAIMASHDGSDVPVGELTRQGDDTNEFSWDGTPIYYNSYAQQLGLKYSDFGILQFDTTNMGGDMVYNIPFFGGYDIKNVDNNRMKDLAEDGDIVFTGTAKGQVVYSHFSGDKQTDTPLEGGLMDEQATLTFAQDGTQTLAADFTNWAQIEAVKAANGTNQFIVRESYVANNSPYYLETSPAGLEDGVMNEHTMAYQTGYYGDNKAPNEAVGLVQYQYMHGYNADINDYEHHVNVDLGFGGTRQ